MGKMEIDEKHKALLLKMGLREEDFDLFDGTYVRYEYAEGKGVRIYDPYYATSYNEYIDVDGWSSWSSENDTFMSDILRDARKEMQRRESMSPKPGKEEISEALKKKFGETSDDS